MRYFVLMSVSFSVASCRPDAKWSRQQISGMEKALLEESARKMGQVDSTTLNNLLAKYLRYAELNPTDPQSLEYLFRASDFYRSTGRPLKSIDMYERISLQFPSAEKTPIAVFLEGFIYENELQNYTAAQAQYHRFIIKYPHHALVDDAVASIKNLGKTPDQLVREFEAQQAGADSVALP